MLHATVPAPPREKSTAPPDLLRPAVGGVILLAVGLRLLLLFAARATEEDYFITLRYAENLASGHGFVYNPGEHVLGTTTPLYTLLLALFVRLHLDPTLCGKLLSIVADGLSCWCAARLGKTLGKPLAGLAAALCLAVSPINLTEATKGMEASLVAAAGAAAWTAWAERKEVLAWMAAALLVLLRIDGAVLAILLLGATLLRPAPEGGTGVRARVPWRGLLVFGLLLLPWLLFATWYFGSPIPTSLRAKLIVYAWHSPTLFPNLIPFLRQMTHNPLNAALFAGAVLYGLQRLKDNGVNSFAGSLRRSVRQDTKPPPTPPSKGGEGETSPSLQGEADRGLIPPSPLQQDAQARTLSPSPLEGCSLRRCEAEASRRAGGRGEGRDPEIRSAPEPYGGGERELAAPFLWILLHYSGMAFSKVFLFGWYFVPPTPIYYLAAMLGIGAALEWVLKARRWPWNPERMGVRAAAALLAAGVVLSVGIVPRVFAALKKTQEEEEERLRIPIGLWLRNHAAPQETVMLEPIGYIGYLSRLRVLDTVGLVSPEVLPYYAPQIDSPYHALWTRFQPEWVLLRAGEWDTPHESRNPGLKQYEAALPASERLESRYRLVQTFPLSPGDASASPAFFLFRRLHP